MYNVRCVKTAPGCGAGTERGAMKMAWIVLLVAGLFEAGMVMGLNFSEGFTRLWPSLLMVVSGGISFYLLSAAMQSVPVGTAYAVWTAIGASGAVLLGILFLGEPANLLRMAGIVVVLGGVLMLKLAEG
jgi:quaternary ammonium compound-resistance protein SugE